jgi:hypothetical protein
VTVDHRQLGVDLFNEVWQLMLKPGGRRSHDPRVARVALPLGEAPECKPENLARGEWQISRVYTVAELPESALRHALRCLDHCEANVLTDCRR